MLRGCCFCLFLFFALGGALRAEPLQTGSAPGYGFVFKPASAAPDAEPGRTVLLTRYGQSVLSGVLSVDGLAPTGMAGIGLQVGAEEGIVLRGQLVQDLPQSGASFNREWPGVRFDLMLRF